MKLLIDTEKKTIEVYGEGILSAIHVLAVANLLRTINLQEYRLTRAPQSILGTVPEMEYNSDSTDKPQ
jgi:hypothetical protein